jgi:c-di-GMP-binding flagellar brake protein YcgR
MKLSAEQFADLVASFPGSAKPAVRHERRRAARIELRAHVTIRTLKDQQLSEPATVTVVNFSPRGLGLVLDEPLTAGTNFVTELHRKSGGSVLFLCTVMHCRAAPDEKFQAGVEFTCVLRQGAAHPQREDASDGSEARAQVKRARASVLE